MMKASRGLIRCSAHRLTQVRSIVVRCACLADLEPNLQVLAPRQASPRGITQLHLFAEGASHEKTIWAPANASWIAVTKNTVRASGPNRLFC